MTQETVKDHANTIWKFTLARDGCQEVFMPEGAIPLSVQMQGNFLFLWAAVSDENKRVPRKFFVVGTGRPLPSGKSRFLATVIDGQFVCHVFEGQ